MKKALLLIIPILIYSCVPVKIAPNIKDNKVMKAKKFKRQLPNQYAFIFEDPKEADEFYNYINIKYQQNDTNGDFYTPFKIGEKKYSMSFYETDKETKTVNLIPIVVDAKRESNGNNALLSELHTSRTGQWYIVITVADNDGENPLIPNHKEREIVINYLENLRKEYLNTSNYYDALFKKKS